MRAPEGRSVQQLAEVLASLGVSSTEADAQQGAVERVAECFESEVGVLVRDRAVVASIGFRSDAPLPAELVQLAGTDGGRIEVPGAGTCVAVVVPVPAADPLRLLLARAGAEGYSLEEISLLRSLGRILATALDMLRLRDEVAKSEAQFRGIVETASEGIWLLDPQGATAFANDKMADLLGLSPDELKRTTVFDVVDERGRVQAERNLKRRREGLSDQLECALVRKDGSNLWVLLHASPVFDSEGEFTGSLCMISDINERKRIEGVLLQREQQLAEAQRVAGLGSFEWDLANLTASWSDGLYRILDLEPGSLRPDIGEFMSFIHPEDQAAVHQRVQRTLGGEDVGEIEYRIRRRTSEVIWVRARSEVVRDGGGQPLLFRGTLLDVNASKLVEDALRTTTTRLRLLEAMATAANEASGLEQILDIATRGICEHTGWVAGHAYVPADSGDDGLVPLPIWHLANREWSQRLDDALASGGETPGGLPGRVLATHEAAWTRRLDVRCETALERKATELGCRGSFAFPVCVGPDLSCILEFFSVDPVEPDPALLDTIRQVGTQLSRVAERQRANHELSTARDAAMESSRLKSDFLATMSHEIRTPMNGVIGLTGLLLDTQLDERQRQFAEGVESAGEALLAIINDILDLSKIEAGKLELEEADFDLVQVVEEAVGLVAQTAHRKGLELISDIGADVPTAMRGDPARLRQVLLNLASNATKFTSAGEVIVRASLVEPTDDSSPVRFEVIDTGIGIPEDAYARLFESFSQADASTTRKNGGKGLGLAISRRLVNAMGGELGFDSRTGEGSTFWFTLPLRRQITPSLVVTPPLPRLNVLVVDPNASARTAIGRRLRAWGMECACVGDRATALGVLRAASNAARPHDVVLVDSVVLEGDRRSSLVDDINADSSLADARVILLRDDAFGSRERTAHPRISGAVAKPVRLGQLREALAPQASTETRSRAWPTIQAGRARGHVLVVEDNATNQLVAVGILRFLGYRADVAANGFEALEAMERTEYAAVLMDCQMPEMDGYSATREIRRIEGSARHTPIIAMTAGAGEPDRERCLAAGMDDYLAKPVKAEYVDAALSRWTSERESAVSAG